MKLKIPLFFLIFFASYQVVSAQVVITEVMYDVPGSDSGREWVEIYNRGNTDVDITEWRFFENETHHYIRVFQGGEIVGPHEYVVFADKPEQFLKDHPLFQGKIFDSSFSLKNSGEYIALKNGDEIVHELFYDTSLGAGGDGYSLQFIQDEWTASLPTPGSINEKSFRPTVESIVDTEEVVSVDIIQDEIFVLDKTIEGERKEEKSGRWYLALSSIALLGVVGSALAPRTRKKENDKLTADDITIIE